MYVSKTDLNGEPVYVFREEAGPPLNMKLKEKWLQAIYITSNKLLVKGAETYIDR